MARYRIAIEFDVDAYDAKKAQEQAQKVADMLNKHSGRRAWVSRAIKKNFSDDELEIAGKQFKSTLF